MFVDFLFELIGFVLTVWSADSEIRNRTMLGESEAEKASRRFVAVSCSIAIGVLAVFALIAWWFLF
jgi:hypothetical protein